ncbi:MAG: rod shape-determining protein [Bacteroidota bacterium]|nr:rod shape-determining protein [Bacteroidota bacterium]
MIWAKGHGIVLNEPSVVAYDRTTRQLIALGHEAQAMVGKTHRDIRVIRPLKDGVIADFEIAESMLRAFIRRVTNGLFPPRRVVVCVPVGITEVEKRAVRDSAEHAGAKDVYLLPEPMAAAIGVGINVHEPTGNMIVDIGGGTTEIAVIALSGIVAEESVRIAGDEMTNAIIQHFRRQYNMLIGERTAETIKCRIGSAVPLDEEYEIEVRGRNLVSGIPQMLRISSEEVRQALEEPITIIVQAVLALLEHTPPELAADIYERGIILTGGGALLKGLDKRLEQVTELPVHVAEDPLTAVARGGGKVLENFEQYQAVLLKPRRL